MRSVLLAGLLCILPLGAQQDPLAAKGFAHFYNLEYDQAMAEFEKAIVAETTSADLHNHLAQTILFREMYRVGALESELVSGNNSFLRRPKLNPAPDTEKKFNQEIQKAIDLAQARLKKDPRDANALYSLGISYGLRANYNYLVRKAWRDALHDATTGRKLHNKITEIDPANVDARLMQGLHDYLVGSLPVIYKMFGFLVGFHGDREKGIRTVEEVARKGNYNRVDAQIFLCALYRREKNPAKALPLLEDLLVRFPRNYLLRFEQGQMYLATGQRAKAITAIEAVAGMKTSGAPGYADVPWEKIYFQLGTIQFWSDDLERALESMKKVTSSPHELDLNTGVLAWMRLGQIYDLTNRRPLAIEAYKKAIAFAPQADAATESRRYLSTPYHRAKS